MGKPPSEYNYNHATSSSKNSANGIPPFANRPLPFLCHESAMNQRGHSHMINNQGTCCSQQPLLSNEHIYTEYEPYQHRQPYNPRWVSVTNRAKKPILILNLFPLIRPIIDYATAMILCQIASAQSKRHRQHYSSSTIPATISAHWIHQRSLSISMRWWMAQTIAIQSTNVRPIAARWSVINDTIIRHSSTRTLIITVRAAMAAITIIVNENKRLSIIGIRRKMAVPRSSRNLNIITTICWLHRSISRVMATTTTSLAMAQIVATTMKTRATWAKWPSPRTRSSQSMKTMKLATIVTRATIRWPTMRYFRRAVAVARQSQSQIGIIWRPQQVRRAMAAVKSAV